MLGSARLQYLSFGGIRHCLAHIPLPDWIPSGVMNFGGKSKKDRGSLHVNTFWKGHIWEHEIIMLVIYIVSIKQLASFSRNGSVNTHLVGLLQSPSSAWAALPSCARWRVTSTCHDSTAWLREAASKVTDPTTNRHKWMVQPSSSGLIIGLPTSRNSLWLWHTMTMNAM